MAKTTAEYLISIANSKEAIRQAIVSKGQSCNKTVAFSGYAKKILDITTGKDFYQCYFAKDGVWSGYKAVLTDGKYHFEKEITEGLTYTSVTPVAGKIYTADALAEIVYLYDINGCPNLVECVLENCPVCSVEYCKTHETHTCSSASCPNKADCEKTTCPDCNEEYCKTHETHTCEKECPDLATCNVVTCEDCGEEYCKTHDLHNHDSAQCPNLPTCFVVRCEGCSTEYCEVHGEHTCSSTGGGGGGGGGGGDNKKCPDLPTCVMVTCSEADCGTEYCQTHQQHSHGEGGSVVTTKKCKFAGCTNPVTFTCDKCQENRCAAHAEGNIKPCASNVCDKQFCPSCADNHGCGIYSTAVCNYKGCGKEENCKKCTGNCGGWYCGEHYYRHDCNPILTRFCEANGCTETNAMGAVMCVVCKDWYCAVHRGTHGGYCSFQQCGQWICNGCESDHVCDGVTCDKCSNAAVIWCRGCGGVFCNTHKTREKCGSCKKYYCDNCYNDKNKHSCVDQKPICQVENCGNVMSTTCAGGDCGKALCSDHYTQCVCDRPFCSEHINNHDCPGGSTVNKCSAVVDGNRCSNDVEVVCKGKDCGVGYCAEHKSLAPLCTSCQKNYCTVCMQNHTCETTAECQVSGCSITNKVKCENCDKLVCKDHMYCADCKKNYCGEHLGSGHNCPGGGKTCSSANCTNKATTPCAFDGCDQAYCDEHKVSIMECGTCNFAYCPEHLPLDKHDCPGDGETCSVDGCSNVIQSACINGDLLVCNDHMWKLNYCTDCGSYYCPNCYIDKEKHSCIGIVPGLTCDIEGCGNYANSSSTGNCYSCGKAVCAEHYANNISACTNCSRFFCDDCKGSHECGGTTES